MGVELCLTYYSDHCVLCLDAEENYDALVWLAAGGLERFQPPDYPQRGDIWPDGPLDELGVHLPYLLPLCDAATLWVGEWDWCFRDTEGSGSGYVDRTLAISLEVNLDPETPRLDEAAFWQAVAGARDPDYEDHLDQLAAEGGG